MTLTLPPCSLAATSMAEPTTCTDSACGAISSCTLAARPDGRVLAANPGAVTTSFVSGVSGAFSSKAPASDVIVCATTPTRLVTETCAPGMGAPDGSTTLPLIWAAERQAESSNKQAGRPETVI